MDFTRLTEIIAKIVLMAKQQSGGSMVIGLTFTPKHYWGKDAPWSRLEYTTRFNVGEGTEFIMTQCQTQWGIVR